MIVSEPQSSDRRQVLGRAGELAAEDALRASGLTILERRYRVAQGEIDLVALDGEVLVFVEVKTRAGTGYGCPWEAVVPRKQERIARVALVYLARRGLLERRCRFDVVEVLRTDAGLLEVRHIADAFRPGEARGGRGGSRRRQR